MAISRRFDPATFTEDITDIVRFWLIDDEDELAPSTSLAGRCGRDGPCHAALDAEDLPKAAEAIRAWFTSRLLDLGLNHDPVDRLAADLLGATIEAVDWMELADEIRD